MPSNIQELSLEAVMSERFGRYSKYIIQERALPDIRDGLKPVQRRILYAMYRDHNTHDKAFKKSAKSVGNVMGNFHPHGDSSIYEALVRLSQPWKVKTPLIEMHGNNGSMDGDPPAAMRYTEARLSPIAEELLADIDKNTVPMVENFDDTQKEPTVLPAYFPNLLVNGATGISAGYATNIPPHNLGEVANALAYLIDHKDATLADLMQFVSGPDFPTGGILQGTSGIKKAYETGIGKAILRAKTQIESLKAGKSQIVITEIPYDVNKANLVKKIDEIRLLKKVDGIGEVRDESDRDGLRIVVELKKNAAADVILNYLLKNTELQITYNFNMVAINHKRPEHVGLKAILTAYLKHQQEVFTKRIEFDLTQAKRRQHIVAGLIKALSLLDDVIKTIRNAKNKADAKVQLVANFAFSEKQAEAIVTLQLYRLTNTDVTTLKEEHHSLAEKIAEYTALLEDDGKLNAAIKQKILAVSQKYAPKRQTQIQAQITPLKIDTQALVADETVMVQVSQSGYVKRSSLRSYQASEAGDNAGLKADDKVILARQASTKQHLVMITNLGHMIYRPVHEVKEVRFKDTGEHLSQSVGLEENEVILAAYLLDGFDDASSASQTLLLATKLGNIKQTRLADLTPGRTYRSRASVVINLKQNDILLCARLINAANKDVMCISHHALGLRYGLDEVSTMGARAAGVKAMALGKDDYLVAVLVVDDASKVGLITQRGAFKVMQASQVSPTSRARKGVQILRPLKTNPHTVVFAAVVANDAKWQLFFDDANPLEFVPGTHSPVDRYSNGSFIFDEKATGQLCDVAIKPVQPKND